MGNNNLITIIICINMKKTTVSKLECLQSGKEKFLAKDWQLCVRWTSMSGKSTTTSSVAVCCNVNSVLRPKLAAIAFYNVQRTTVSPQTDNVIQSHYNNSTAAWSHNYWKTVNTVGKNYSPVHILSEKCQKPWFLWLAMAQFLQRLTS